MSLLFFGWRGFARRFCAPVLGATVCASVFAIPSAASASTYSQTIRYDDLCSTLRFSTCGRTGVTDRTDQYVSPYFNAIEPGVFRMSFDTPTDVVGDGTLSLRFFGDFNSPQEYLDVMIEPPAFIDSTQLRNDRYPELDRNVTPNDQPRQDSCRECSISADGIDYPYSRLANVDPNDDIFVDAAPVSRPRGGGRVELDQGSQWRDVLVKEAVLPEDELAVFIADGKFDLAFHVPEGEVQGNPFTDGATYTDEQRANFDYNWIEATLTFETAPAAVPLPAPVLFLLTGLAGFGVLRRRNA